MRGKDVKSANFDRWANARRNKRLRNFCLAGMGFSMLIAAVIVLDSLVTNTPLNLGRLFIFGVLFVVSFSFATYYHLRFMSRE